MKDLFNKYNDEDLDINHIKKEEDPLWDEAKPVLLGFAFYRLEPVSYLMSNESQISIVSSNGDVMGKMEVDIIPHDENGNEYDEVPETPTELIGQSLMYKVLIKNLEGIPKNLSYDLHVEYQCFFDHSTVKTKVYNKVENDNKNNVDNLKINNTNNIIDNNNNNFSEDEKVDIEINESFEHKIDYLTKEDIDFLVKDKVCFKIFSSERIEKKGRIPIKEETVQYTNKESEINEPQEIIKPIDNYIHDDNINSNKKNDEPVDIMKKKNNDKIDKKKGENNKNKNSNKKNDKNDKNKNKKDCIIF
jgi:hypothetical protein